MRELPAIGDVEPGESGGGDAIPGDTGRLRPVRPASAITVLSRRAGIPAAKKPLTVGAGAV